MCGWIWTGSRRLRPVPRSSRRHRRGWSTRIGRVERWSLPSGCRLAGRVRVSRELGLDFAGGSECFTVQHIKILTHSAWGTCRDNLPSLPIFGIAEGLLLDSREDQTGIDGEALTTNKPLPQCNARWLSLSIGFQIWPLIGIRYRPP